MTTKGFVNNDLEPVVGIRLMLGKRSQEALAIIDTGFNGYLSAPFQLISDSDWEFVGYEKYEMANGEVVETKVFLGNIVFNGEHRQVRILSSRTRDVLIGTRLLAETILNINFKRKHLTIEKV